MKTEYMLYHRTTHKNGRVGSWVMDGTTYDPKWVKWYVDFNTSGANRLGKTIEHKLESREVNPWRQDDLDKVLKLAENKEVKDGE